MPDLDQQIRAELASYDDSGVQLGNLTDAVRAVLDIPPYDLTRPTGHLVDDAQRRAWNRALERCRMGIAYQLGLTQETTP